MPTNTLIEKARRIVSVEAAAEDITGLLEDIAPISEAFLRAVELLRGMESSWHPDCDDDACEVRDFLRDIGAEKGGASDE